MVELLNNPSCLLKTKSLGKGRQLLNIYINMHS